jgi:ribosomal protein S18 acetylase RimI-like enzyme
MIEIIRTSTAYKCFAYRSDSNEEVVGRFDVDTHLNVIWNLFIVPEHRNKGYATAMLKEFIEQYQSDKPLMLYVKHENTIAIHLYEKLGFAIVGNYNRYAYKMVKMP